MRGIFGQAAIECDKLRLVWFVLILSMCILISEDVVYVERAVY